MKAEERLERIIHFRQRESTHDLTDLAREAIALLRRWVDTAEPPWPRGVLEDTERFLDGEDGEQDRWDDNGGRDGTV